MASEINASTIAKSVQGVIQATNAVVKQQIDTYLSNDVQIKVDPDKLTTGASRVEKYLEDYKNTISKLISIIENNEAQLDAITQNELLKSCKAMETKFNDMYSFLNMALDVTKEVAKEFKNVNNDSAKIIPKI